MSISPPSDIILDVARAADPARLREAATRLTGTRPVDGEFAAALASAAPPAKPAPAAPPAAASQTGTMVAPPAASGTQSAEASPAVAKATTPPATAYRDFEGMVLAELLQSVMPKDDSLFGSGTSGGVWQGLFVQEIGKAVAAKGGVGIAAALLRSASLHAGGATGTPASDALGATVGDPWAGIALDAKKSIWSGA